MKKYEYLTSEDLGYKPGVVEQAKFEYSPLGKIFNKELKEKDKKEGLLKRLKNTEGKNEELLNVVKDHGEKQLKAIMDQSRTGMTLLKSIYTKEDKIII